MAKVADNQENFSRCRCVNCPTMNECGRKANERIFCSRGKGACNYKSNGCICGSCPVHRENKLDNYYYCRQGSAEIIG